MWIYWNSTRKWKSWKTDCWVSSNWNSCEVGNRSTVTPHCQYPTHHVFPTFSTGFLWYRWYSASSLLSPSSIWAPEALRVLYSTITIQTVLVLIQDYQSRNSVTGLEPHSRFAIPMSPLLLLITSMGKKGMKGPWRIQDYEPPTIPTQTTKGNSCPYSSAYIYNFPILVMGV